MKNEVREIVDEARRQGWRVKELKSGHVMLYAPDGMAKVTLPGTPSDHRSMMNSLSRMRQAGFQWPPERRW